MIPQLLLEEILLGEKNEKDYYDKYGKEEVCQALRELKKSNEEILSAYPVDKMQDEVMEKAIAEKNSVKVTKKPVQSVWKFSAVAALLLVFVSPVLMRNFAADDASPSVRVKGNAHHQIRLYRQEGGEANLLKNGDSAKENDLIQITYTPGAYNYGLIFSVDGNGNLTRHFPENSWESAKLQKTGEEVPLSFSYALDDAPDYECFIFVASKNPFDLKAIENIEKSSYSIKFLKKGSYLPEGCDGSIFVLKKD